MLNAHGVTIRYGSFTAVRAVSLDIADGEVVALLGPSGSGKSTLLRGIAGLEPIVAGSVCWDGNDLGDTPVHRRGFGLVFQDGQLFQHRDVESNIAFGLKMHGVAKGERGRRIDNLLELVGLAGYHKRRVTQLSGGEAQRVALARALAPEPRLLLLDEPLSGLDASLREQLAIDLVEVLRQAKITALLVTHDQQEAFTVADRVALLDNGEIRQTGNVDTVWRRPSDDRIARFLGVTTVLNAVVRDGVVSSDVGEAVMPALPEGEIRIGLRPNALHLAERGVEGKVIGKVHRRDHIRLIVSMPKLGKTTVDAVAPVSAEIVRGERIRLALDRDGIAVIGAE